MCDKALPDVEKDLEGLSGETGRLKRDEKEIYLSVDKIKKNQVKLEKASNLLEGEMTDEVRTYITCI